MKQKIFQFENFILDQKNGRMLFRDKSVVLTPKDFEILSFLVENSLRTVEKQEIFEAVWPNSFVEENNLPVRISSLRNLFRRYGYAKEFIRTVSGRGYIFIVEARELSQKQAEGVIEKPVKSTIVSEADNLYFKGQYILDTIPTRSNLYGDLFQAEHFFNSAVRLNPNFTEAYIGNAYCKIYLYNYGRLTRGEAHLACKSLFQQAQSIIPDSLEISLLRAAMTLVFELNVLRAIKLLNKIVQQNPEDSRAYYWLGLSHIFLGNPETSYGYFVQASEIKPDDIRFRAALIQVHYSLRDYNRAITTAKDILEMDSRSYAALFYLCLSYARLDIFGDAEKYCNELSEIIDNDEIRLLRAYINVLNNRPGEIEELIKEIVSDEKRLCKCLIFIILIYTAQDKCDEAFTLLVKYSNKAHFDILLVNSEPGLIKLRENEKYKIILTEFLLLPSQ